MDRSVASIADVSTELHRELIKQLLKLNFRNKEIRTNTGSVQEIAEIIKVYAIEGITRSAVDAQNENTNIVTIKHLERILPEFLADL